MNLVKRLKGTTLTARFLYQQMEDGDAIASSTAKYLTRQLLIALIHVNDLHTKIDPESAAKLPLPPDMLGPNRRKPTVPAASLIQ